MAQYILYIYCSFSYNVYAVCPATIVLDSSVACPGKVVTYTCTVRQEAVLDWIVEPFLPASACIQFLTTRPIRSSLDCNDTSTLQCADLDFVATLTNFTNPTTVPGGTVADIHCCGQTEWDSGAVQRINCSWNSKNKPNPQCGRYIHPHCSTLSCCLVTVLATADVQHNYDDH